MNPSDPLSWTKVSICSATWAGVPTSGPFELVDHHFAEGEFLRFGHLTQAPRGGEAILMEERAALDDRRCVGIGVDIGDRTLGVITGQIAIPDLLEQDQRGLPGDLLIVDGVVLLHRFGFGVPEHETGRGQNLYLIGRASRRHRPGEEPARLTVRDQIVGLPRIP